jgi:hypothetical protein
MSRYVYIAYLVINVNFYCERMKRPQPICDTKRTGHTAGRHDAELFHGGTADDLTMTFESMTILSP